MPTRSRLLSKLSFSLSFVEVNYSDHKHSVSFGKLWLPNYQNINHVGKNTSIENWVFWVYDFINSVKYTELVNVLKTYMTAFNEQLVLSNYITVSDHLWEVVLYFVTVKQGWADWAPTQLFVVECFWLTGCGSFSCAPSDDPFFWKPDHRSYKDEAQSGLDVDVWRGAEGCTLDWICERTWHIGIWGPLGSGTLCRLNLC